MQDNDENARPLETVHVRPTLRLSIAGLNRLLRKARQETRKAQAHEKWISSIRAARIRAANETHVKGGDE